MASKEYQIKWVLEALDKASGNIAAIEKRLERLDKIHEKTQNNLKKRDQAYVSWWGKELDKKDNRDKKSYQDWLKNAEARANSEKSINEKRRKAFTDGILKQRLENKKNDEKSYQDWLKNAEARQKSEAKIINQRKKAYKEGIERQISANNALKQAEEKRVSAAIKSQKEAANQAEQAAKNQSRLETRRQREQRSNALRAYTDVSHALDSARTAMMYVSTPTAVNAMFALKNAMSMEQLGIRMRTQFGAEEGNKLLVEMKEYAAKTAFSLDETVDLLSNMQMSRKGLGINSNAELISSMKSIGNVLLAYAQSPEARREIVTQIGQIAMSGQANTRQDLMVMARNGLPIIPSLEKYTGKSMAELKDKFGANLPSTLIFDVLKRMAQSPEVISAMDERTKSLTQSWDNFKQQVFFVSAGYGQVLNKQFKISDHLNKASDSLGNIEKKMLGIDKESGSIVESALGFGTAYAVAVPTMMVAYLTMKKMFAVSVQTAGSAAALTNSFRLATGLFSALYLTTIDWKKVLNDTKEEGFGGIMNNMDSILIGAFAILQVMKGWEVAALAAAEASSLAASVVYTGGIAGAGYLGYKGGKAFGENADVQNFFERIPELWDPNHKPFIIDPAIEKRNLERIERDKKNAELSEILKNSGVAVHNNINVDAMGKVTGNTKVVRNPFANPVTYDMTRK